MEYNSRSEQYLDQILEDKKYHKVTVENRGEHLHLATRIQLDWCIEHCNSKFRDITIDASREHQTVRWYFESEEDATHFALRWA